MGGVGGGITWFGVKVQSLGSWWVPLRKNTLQLEAAGIKAAGQLAQIKSILICLTLSVSVCGCLLTGYVCVWLWGNV